MSISSRSFVVVSEPDLRPAATLQATRAPNIGEKTDAIHGDVKQRKTPRRGVLPDQKLLTDMGKSMKSWSRPESCSLGRAATSSKGARVRFSGTKRTVIDGPFAETKELIAGSGCGRSSRRMRRSNG